ncbi:hypothetical protein [Burkholderia sp. S171]|uniref:hypothetical protein n=1 Tax=Burkholderia sp. S171 TaxID=1641860 RepID=UPI00131E4B68|nr:hypothetical protein [Burkholderia sp. S171]
MSRMSLVAAAKRVGVPTTIYARGKTWAKSNEGLRIDLLERCYGNGLGVQTAKTMTELDARIVRAVDCCKGEHGWLLSTAQHALMNANNDRFEANRIAALKRPRPEEIARLRKSAVQWYEVARIAQNMHSIEVGMRDGKESDYKESLINGTE